MMMDKIPVIAVVGPTASGKTALSVELALRLDGEIISADSMQIYKHMDIATAKPTEEEKKGVPHHLMDFLEPSEDFSVARFCELAKPIIADIRDRGKIPVIAGGTGLYVDSLLGNVDFAETETDPDLRAELRQELETKGVDGLLEDIRAFDPESAERLSVGRNPKRILRCIEVYRLSGMTQTQLNIAQTAAPSPYKAIKIGLTASDRTYLYERINRRVDVMLDNGLIDEARAFCNADYGTTANAAIGYKELLPYLLGDLSLDECVENLKRATRRYAKRQLTWFRRDPSVHWFEIDRMSFEQILGSALTIIDKDGCYDEVRNP